MDLQLTSLRADRQRRYTIPGLRIAGHNEDLVLLVVWTGASKAYQEAIANDAFVKLKPEEGTKALIHALAAHVIVGWECVPLATRTAGPDVEGKPLAYTAERGAQILSQFEAEQRGDLTNAFLSFIRSGSNFQRSLVDPVDLGNG
jgi:hypothetical protein